MANDATPRSRRGILRRTLFGIGAVLGVLLVTFAAIIGNFLFLGAESASQQQERFDRLVAEVDELSDAEIAAWIDGSAAPGLSDDVPFNRVQFVASHNSYVTAPTGLQRFFIDLVEPGWGEKLDYSHEPLWDQLESGIRSIELDIRPNGDGFEMTHVPLVANRGNAVDFGLALREIALWSDAHPGHLPISIMVEAKDDYAFLDPRLKPWNAGEWDRLDELVSESLGDRLLTPAELRGDAATMTDAVAGGWPTVGELRGRVMLFFCNGETVREAYLEGHEQLDGRSIFTSSQTGATDAVFAVRDDPADAAIPSDVAAGLIVRTRADADMAIDERMRDGAFASGAQLVSTDFPPLEPHATGYEVAFDGGSLARPTP